MKQYNNLTSEYKYNHDNRFDLSYYENAAGNESQANCMNAAGEDRINIYNVCALLELADSCHAYQFRAV